MCYSGDHNRTISILTGTIADGAVSPMSGDASVSIGDMINPIIWVTGTVTEEVTGTIDLVIRGKTGDMPFYIDTGTISLLVISTGTPIFCTATELVDFKFSMLDVVSVKNDLGTIIADIQIKVCGMDKV